MGYLSGRLCPGESEESLSGDLPTETPRQKPSKSEKRMVHIILECFLVMHFFGNVSKKAAPVLRDFLDL